MLRITAIFLLICFQPSFAYAQPSWKLITEEQGIQVFSQPVTYSKIKALKVACELKATTSELVALLLDVNAAEQWVYHTKSCVLLRKISDSELYYYSEVSLPWPLDNRDFVAHIKVSQDPLTKIVTVNAPAVSGWMDRKEGIVRINQSKGLWVIRPAGKDKINLEYTLQVDPGGGIPAWAVNMFASQGPIETFKNMRQQLGTDKYKHAILGFILN